MERPHLPETYDPLSGGQPAWSPGRSFHTFRAGLTGQVVLPGDPAWDGARRAWNLTVDQRPAAVVLPGAVEDVAATIVFARDQGLRIAVQGTGHGAASLGPLGNTILVRTTPIQGVRVDPNGRRARVGAGVAWRDVLVASQRFNLAPLAGSAPDVGVAGYSLGGGIGWLARLYGSAADSILGLDVITADGRAMRVDDTTDPELFWALRGGGGGFGAVTALELRLHPVPDLYAGALCWPIDHAEEVLHRWLAWTRQLPDEVTSVARLARFPPIPDIPQPMRGRAWVTVEAALALPDPRAISILRPLRALRPELDTFRSVPPPRLTTLHLEPELPAPALGDGFFLARLSAEVITAVLAVEGPGANGALLSFDLRHLGGALARPNPARGAFAAAEPFLAHSIGLGESAEERARLRARMDEVRVALKPWSTGRSYLNFCERSADPGTFFPADTLARLRTVKRRVDPTDLFRSNHPIPPASSEPTPA